VDTGSCALKSRMSLSERLDGPGSNRELFREDFPPESVSLGVGVGQGISGWEYESMIATQSSRTGRLRGECRRERVAALALMLAGIAGPTPVRADTLEAALLKQAPQVIGYLKVHGYRNVGVLKFRVKKGNQPASDHVGPLNLNLAGRLEIALVLANDNQVPLGIIRDADGVAATLPGANHLTRPGRQALFRGRYPLAWGDQQVAPDAFLTGVAVVSPDLKQMTVAILAFGKDARTLDNVVRFTASTDAPALAEAGESFLIRGAFDAGRTEEVRETVVASAARVKVTPETNPLRDASAPVALEIRYDNQLVPLEIRDGKAEVREPREGEKIAFVLRKIDRTSDRYGVVLLVNDVNTLFKERTAPLHAPKWILGPDHRETVVHGYQTGAQTAEAFRVLAPEESKSHAVHYGPAAGTITLVVFREQTVREEPPLLDDDAEDVVALSRGVLPAERPQTLAALKFRLREGRRGEARGLIGEGQRIGAAVRNVAFPPDPTPVMSATITYFRPGGRDSRRVRWADRVPVSHSSRSAQRALRDGLSRRPDPRERTQRRRVERHRGRSKPCPPWFRAAVSRVRS